MIWTEHMVIYLQMAVSLRQELPVYYAIGYGLFLRCVQPLLYMRHHTVVLWQHCSCFMQLLHFRCNDGVLIWTVCTLMLFIQFGVRGKF